METKLTPKEYAELHNISLVTVNKRIKNNVIKSIKEDNRRYIIIDDENTINADIIEETTSKPLLTNDLENLYKERINDLLRINKQLYKHNKQLIKENRELNNESKAVYKQFIGEMKLLLLPPEKKEKKKK